MCSLVPAAQKAVCLPQAPKHWDPVTPTSDTGSQEQGWDSVLDAGMVMPLSAPWESFALVQWMRNRGSSWDKNAGLSPFLPQPEAWGTATTEGWPREGDGGELHFGPRKIQGGTIQSGIERPNPGSHSQPWDRGDAPGLAGLGVPMGAGERGSGSGSCRAGAWGAGTRAGAVPCLVGFLSMRMPGSSCPAGVTHFLLLCHILVRPVWQRLSSLPPWLLLLLSPTAEGWDVHLLSPWQDEAGFSGNCVKATKPPHIYIKKKNQPNKNPSTIFLFSFFEHEGDWRPDGLLCSSPRWGGCFPREGTGPGRRAVKVCWAAEGKKNAAQMQLGLILPSAASRRGAAGGGLPAGSL